MPREAAAPGSGLKARRLELGLAVNLAMSTGLNGRCDADAPDPRVATRPSQRPEAAGRKSDIGFSVDCPKLAPDHRPS